MTLFYLELGFRPTGDILLFRKPFFGAHQRHIIYLCVSFLNWEYLAGGGALPLL
jgi:hypothetical protein